MTALILSALSAAKGLFSGITLKGLGIALAVLAGLFIAYEGLGMVRQAEADHAAVALLTVQRDEAVKVADDNAHALASNRNLHDSILISAQAAAVDAQLRSTSLEAELQELHDAPKSVCIPSDVDRRILERLR